MGLSDRSQPYYDADFAFARQCAHKMLPSFLAAAALKPMEVLASPLHGQTPDPLPSTLPVMKFGQPGAPERWAPFARAAGAVIASGNPAIDGLADGLLQGLNEAAVNVANEQPFLKLTTTLLARDVSFASAWRPALDPTAERHTARVLLEVLSSAPAMSFDIHRHAAAGITSFRMASLTTPLLLGFNTIAKNRFDLGKAAKHLDDVGERARADVQDKVFEELPNLPRMRVLDVTTALVGIGVLPEPDGRVSNNVIALVQPRFTLTPMAIERRVNHHVRLPAVVVPDLVTVDEPVRARVAVLAAVASHELTVSHSPAAAPPFGQ